MYPDDNQEFQKDPKQARQFIEEELSEIDTYEEQMAAFDEWANGCAPNGSLYLPLAYIAQQHFSEETAD